VNEQFLDKRYKEALSVMRGVGLEPDDWQLEVLAGGHQRLLLNCCRQAGKSTAVAMLNLMTAIQQPGTLVLILSKSLRQSRNLFRLVTQYHERLGGHMLKTRTKHELELTHFSRVISLPCREDTIRGFANVGLLVIDEAARVPDDLYHAVRPMLAVSDGRLVCLSTPYGRRGFFYHAWTRGGADWTRIEVPVERIPRIRPEFLEEERRAHDASWFRQEYQCSFETVSGLVYPTFAQCALAGPASQKERLARAAGKKVGGIDFGYRDPFAAVWGVLDAEGVLWLTGEHYQREWSLRQNAERLPRDVSWFADPSEPGLIAELKSAGYVIRKANNDRELGITAVRGRVENHGLRICEGWCPNLLAEAQLYRYAEQEEGRGREKPEDGYDHAMDALRYLVVSLDRHRVARWRQWLGATDEAATPTASAPKKKSRWLSIFNEALWRPLMPRE
jgi:hypothetical protein